jgi:hypothetical protein
MTTSAPKQPTLCSDCDAVLVTRPGAVCRYCAATASYQEGEISKTWLFATYAGGHGAQSWDTARCEAADAIVAAGGELYCEETGGPAPQARCACWSCERADSDGRAVEAVAK